jgi:UDP-glucose 4-epimerase
MRVLVAGGLGYIGSHACIELLLQGHEILIVDNLRNSEISKVSTIKKLTSKSFQYLEGDIRDLDFLNGCFQNFMPDAVMHFAGLKSVEESVKSPLIYYNNNVLGSICLLQAMSKYNCKTIIFSSSATVYGAPEYLPLNESHPTNPVNSYGRSKLMVENILSDWALSTDEAKATCLRYFNPIGAHDSKLLGENPKGLPTNLMPLLCRVADHQDDALKIMGVDYSTRDGTGERDYIHVVDLAKAHLAALSSQKKNNFAVYNVGTGRGTTVRELITCFEEINGVNVKSCEFKRRAGDVASVFAQCSKINSEIGWSAVYSIESMVFSAWESYQYNKNNFS